MIRIGINECVYYVHPVYDLYASDKNGNVINLIKKVPNKGYNNRGYLRTSVRKYGGRYKGYLVHRFVWECFNGIIPEEKEIDHINNNKKDNRLCNLQLLTHQQNCKKWASGRDYSFAANNHKNRKCVKAINNTTKEVSYFFSMYAVQQHLQINAGSVKKVCEDFDGYKSGVSKKDGHSYQLEYVEQEDMPENYFKSSNIRHKRLSDEDRKKYRAQYAKKEYKCPRCDKTLTNGSKYYHNKKCL